MELLKDRRIIIALGAALALAAGLILAAVIASGRHGESEAPPASQGGLVVQTGHDDDIKLDPTRPLRCFVNGLLVGQLPLADCAKRNGVAAGALDVGLDPSGALAAAHGTSAEITPLPPPPQVLAADPAPSDASAAEDADARATSTETDPRAGAGACLKYAEASWKRLPYDTSLDTCVQTLYAGQCVPPGVALYGRWGNRTLRLVPGRVEISGDNRNFRALAMQGPACSLPTVSLPSRSPQPG